MRKSLLGCLIASAMCVAPSTANAAVTIVQGTTFAVPSVNDFQSQLAALGLTEYTTTGADLIVDVPSVITFEFLGSESAYDDTFSALGGTPVSLSEYTPFENHFSAPVLIGSSLFGAGSLANSLIFSSDNPNGATATVGQDGFGIFLNPNRGPGPFNTFYLGYDDQINHQDDNHDDFIVKATIRAVPEPATWAMMLVGFMAVGFGLRRRKRPGAARLRFA